MLNLVLKYVGRITGATANYPYGSSKNETGPGVGDGTPYELARADDVFGVQQALLRSASIVPTNNADTALASQQLQALIEIASGRAGTYDDSGVADAYVLDVQTNQQAPGGLFDGQKFEFIPVGDNTGACTANPFGEGVTDIKLAGGVNDPGAGAIKAGRKAKLIYRTTPGVHLELDRSGQTKVVTFTGNGTYTPPTDVKALEMTGVAAAGGSGGVDGQGASTAAMSGSGGGGGASILTTNLIDASYAVVIGVGGVGGAAGNNNGTSGGDTTITSTNVTMVCNGGFFGSGMTAVAGNSNSSSGKGGGASGGDVNLHGSDGEHGIIVSGAPSQASTGGESLFGGSVRGRLDNVGYSPTVPGAGASGSGVRNDTANRAGADGADGVVIVKEFY